MKQIEKIAAAENFSAVNVGKLDELGDYLLELGPEVKIPDFCTPIKNMKTVIFFSKEKENFK